MIHLLFLVNLLSYLEPTILYSVSVPTLFMTSSFLRRHQSALVPRLLLLTERHKQVREYLFHSWQTTLFQRSILLEKRSRCRQPNRELKIYDGRGRRRDRKVSNCQGMFPYRQQIRATSRLQLKCSFPVLDRTTKGEILTSHATR